MLLATLAPFTMNAQSKKSFTLDDLMWGGSNYWNLQPKSRFTAWWGDCLLETNVDEVRALTSKRGAMLKAKEAATPLFTVSDLNAALDTAACGVVRNLTYASFPNASRPEVFLRTNKAHLLYNWEKHAVVWSAPAPTGRVDFSQAGRATAFVRDYNLYVTTADGNTQQVTTDGSRDLVYGESVHRSEFGISKGTFWSGKGNHLAFYRMDQSMVSDFPLVDINHRVAQLAPEKYPMAGMTSHEVSIGVFTPATGKTVYLKTASPKDRYFTNIAWSPDEKTIYVIELPRSQDKAELIAYDAATGEQKAVLYTETNPRYVEPMHPIVFLPWDEGKFIMQSRRDGYNHLYLFSSDGKELAQLTKGAFEVIDFVGFNTQRKSVIIKANANRPLAHTLYSVSVDNAKMTALDGGEGVHSANLSATGAYLVDTWRAPQAYRNIDLVATAGNAPAMRLQTASSPWQEYNVPTVRSGMIKAADHTTDLYYRLVLPPDFDPAKKYPAVVYVYGGPHAHNVDEGWYYGMRPWEAYMAQRGYVLFVLDNRGSEYRGFAFESCTHRQLGEVEMADQMCGVDFLRSLPYVDADRLGVHGWSFGGFMTTNLMCSHPEAFKVGVAGGPVIDWKYYEVMYGERYMDTPQENPAGYAASNLTAKAGNLKGRLQIIVGYNDDTCVLQHSLAFLRAAADAGTQPDYFVYPGQGHNMMGRDMVHLHERITRYFDDYLK